MILGDYHVHSKFSKDAVSTIKDNAQVGLIKGLKQIGSTEHAFYHQYGISKKDLPKIQDEVNAINASHPIRVLMGIEANLISDKGEIDVPLNIQKSLDYVVLGAHKSCKFFTKPFPFVKFFKHLKLRNTSKKQIQRNTESYIKAMENNNINILAHLNYACKVDVAKVGEVAKRLGIYIELNGRKNCLTKEEIKTLVDMGCQFIVNSDAHNAERVADCHKGINIIEKNNIPEDLVANINKLPTFAKRFEW